MVDFIVGILNSIGSGVGDDLVADLLKTPAEYNAGMYQLSLTVARSAASIRRHPPPARRRASALATACATP